MPARPGGAQYKGEAAEGEEPEGGEEEDEERPAAGDGAVVFDAHGGGVHGWEWMIANFRLIIGGGRAAWILESVREGYFLFHRFTRRNADFFCAGGIGEGLSIYSAVPLP
jgi:hypothetical protein